MHIIGKGVIGEELITSFNNKKKNLFVNANKYNPYVAIGHGDGTTEEMYRLSKMYAYLEKGQKYIFSCDVDGIWGDKNGIDTVEAFCFRDGIEKVHPDYMAFHCTKTNTIIFTCNVTGKYYIRIDNNDNSKTHIWKNFKIVKLNNKKNLLQGVKWVQGFAEYTDEISNNSRFPNALSTEKLIRVNAKNTYLTNMYKNKDDYRIRTFDINKIRTGTGFDYINTDGTISLPEGTVYIRVMSIWRQNVEDLYIIEV